MEDIYTSLEKACRESGTNLTKVCRAAGVQRSTVQRWKAKEPNTIRLYRKLLAKIEENKKPLPTINDEVC
jgi:hypothetical protein